MSIPVTTSIEGKSAFPETHPLSLGSGGRANPRPVKRYLADADVILGVGCSFALTGFGVPMPRFLMPKGDSFETIEDRKFRFHVEIRLPILGLMVRYRGWLAPIAPLRRA